LCVSVHRYKEEKQYGVEGETEYEKQTVSRKEKRRGWEGGMNKTYRNSAIKDTGKKKLVKKEAYF
jgi:hypothetical protein